MLKEKLRKVEVRIPVGQFERFEKACIAVGVTKTEALRLCAVLIGDGDLSLESAGHRIKPGPKFVLNQGELFAPEPSDAIGRSQRA